MMGNAQTEFNSQIQGLMISLSVVSLFIVWSLNTPGWLRYGVTGFILLLTIFSLLNAVRKSIHLNKCRRGQAKDRCQVGTGS